MVIHYTDAKGVEAGKTLEAHFAPLLSRPGLAGNEALACRIIEVSKQYIEMMREQSTSMPEFLALVKERSALREQLEDDPGNETLKAAMFKKHTEAILKLEHHGRSEAHLVAINRELVKEFMRLDGIDEYRKHLIGQPSGRPEVFHDEWLKREGRVGCTEAAKRLVGSIIHRSLDMVVHEKGEHGVPFSFSERKEYGRLHNYQKRIVQQRNEMDEGRIPF